MSPELVWSTTKKFLRQFLLRYAPKTALAISAVRFRQSQKSQHLRHRQTARSELFKDRQPVVLSGPFVGMLYIDEFTYGPIAPRWLGVYEPQLGLWMERVAKASYDKLIDIGAGEGYYAVGLKRADPHLKVTTFEADPFSRRAQRRLAALNGVKINIRSICDHKLLGRLLAGQRALIICDIEGAELELIDPGRCPRLLDADLIIETHPNGRYSTSDVTQLIADRFGRTHQISILDDALEVRNNILEAVRASGVDTSRLKEFSDEWRGIRNQWLVLTKFGSPLSEANTPSWSRNHPAAQM